MSHIKGSILIGGFDSQDHSSWKAVYELIHEGKTIAENKTLMIPMIESYEEIPLALRIFRLKSITLAVGCRCSSLMDVLLVGKSSLVRIQSLNLKEEVYNSSLIVKSEKNKASVLVATEESLEQITFKF